MVEAVELSEKDIETLREAVDGCGGPSYTQAIAILDRLSPPAPEVDEATVWAEKVFNKAGYFFSPAHSKVAEAAGVLRELIASKDAAVQLMREDADNAYSQVSDWRSRAGQWQERAEKAESELASKDAEIERLEGAYRIATDFYETEKERAEKAESELAAISAAIGTTEFMDPPDGGSPTLAEQVGRMRSELAALRAENERLNAEVERWARSHSIAFDQAMANGEALSRERAALKAAQEVKA